MIKPTKGRIVLFRTMAGDLLAAMIVHVFDDALVNLTVFEGDGTTFARHKVTLAQGRPAQPFECEWPTKPLKDGKE